MKNFMRQFAGLTPMQKIMLEQALFNLADKLVEDYSGGQWDSIKVGDVWALRIPAASDKAPVTLVNEDAGVRVETDATTASVAFSLLFVNWVWNSWNEKGWLNAASFADFERVYFGLRNGAYADGNPAGINVSDFHDFTD